LREHTPDSASIVSYPEGVVAVALEAVTTTTSTSRIRVEII